MKPPSAFRSVAITAWTPCSCTSVPILSIFAAINVKPAGNNWYEVIVRLSREALLPVEQYDWSIIRWERIRALFPSRAKGCSRAESGRLWTYRQCLLTLQNRRLPVEFIMIAVSQCQSWLEGDWLSVSAEICHRGILEIADGYKTQHGILIEFSQETICPGS